MAVIEQWGLFELALDGPQDGNPFIDFTFGARFRFQHREIDVPGFYDGAGIYRVRFMPDVPGEWEYVTHSSAPQLDNTAGKFTCVAPASGNHGPVRVHNTYHLAYADGTSYWQIGTTCYVWTHQGDALEEQTLETLKNAPFNKMRMCVFPKHYTFNANEPEYYPFEKLENGAWDFERFNPAFFQHFEQRVADLLALGIEADLILFHPYDRWGFATMDTEVDDRYLRYIVARLSAYRNVWWSMANEWDLMKAKSEADWDRFFRIVQENDPSQHLRSVHNWRTFYDYNKPWVTHASIQIVGVSMNLEPIRDWQKQYKKPIIIDECCYEGNIPDRWGNITPQEMVRRFWESTIHGAYAGHGETYLHPQDILWWSKGGVLHGQSSERIAFYQRILDETPSDGLQPLDAGIRSFRWAGISGEYYLGYFGVHQPGRATFELPDGQYQAEVIDTWDMTITALPPSETGKFQIELPSKPYMAVRVRRVIT